MFLFLSEWLTDSFSSAFNFFGYITVRSGIALMTSLVIGLLAGPWVIKKLHQLNYGQSVRNDGPKSHLTKKGTPTMGGILILISIVFSSLLWMDLRISYVWIALLVTIAFGLIGFVDDWRKIIYQNSKGLSVFEKMLLMSIISISAGIYLLLFTPIAQHTYLVMPILKNVYIPIGFVGFIVMFFLVVVGSSNGVNLTDGLDGLAVMPTIFIAGGLAIFAYVSGNAIYARYLSFPLIPGSGELVIFLSTVMGAGLAFLWFNSYPAQIFMGDVGALSLGAALGVVAMIIRAEIILLIMGGVFVIEALSVIFQVGYFKWSKKRYGVGRRLLLMAPLHHHFEQKGWRENQVVVRFWIMTIICVLFGLALLKIR